MKAYGADANPTGNPIGGGDTYSKIMHPDDPGVIRVKTRSDLTAALKAGANLYLDDDYTIDLPAEDYHWPAFHLGSGRGRDGSPGGRIRQPDLGSTTWPYWIYGGAMKLSGLRIEGPDGGQLADQRWSGISGYAEIENSELYNWPMAALWSKSKSYLHHSDLHHCWRQGVGYCAAHGPTADQLIEACSFDYYRHAVEGERGLPGGKYELRYCILGSHNTGNTPVDFHGGNDSSKECPDSIDGTSWGNKECPNVNTPAGHTVLIHHNTCLDPDGGFVAIRGVPVNIVRCYKNWYLGTGDPRKIFIQRLNNLVGNVVDGQLITTSSKYPYGDKYIRMVVEDNWYGPTPPPDVDGNGGDGNGTTTDFGKLAIVGGVLLGIALLNKR